MPVYEVYVICDQCTRPHSTHVKLTVDEVLPEGTRVSEYYADQPLPSSIVFMQSNKYRCPHTKQLFPATDIELASFHGVT